MNTKKLLAWCSGLIQISPLHKQNKNHIQKTKRQWVQFDPLNKGLFLSSLCFLALAIRPH